METESLRRKDHQPQSPKSGIRFTPLHDGMGFHPFSDGLPYAPERKTTKESEAPIRKSQTPKVDLPPMGAGAMSAGPAVFVPPSSQKPMGTARQLAMAKKQDDSKISQSEIKVSAEVVADPQIEREVLRRRFFAYLMDSILHAGFWLTTNLTALFWFEFELDSEVIQQHAIAFVGFYLVSQWMFIALQEILFESSLGKYFFSVEFKPNKPKSLFFRSFVFTLSLLTVIGPFFRLQDRFGEIQAKPEEDPTP